jgi:hypothetical protein
VEDGEYCLCFFEADWTFGGDCGPVFEAFVAHEMFAFQDIAALSEVCLGAN